MTKSTKNGLGRGAESLKTIDIGAMTEKDKTALIDSLSVRNRELELINESNLVINSSLDLDTVLSTILDEIRGLFGVVGSSIWLKNPETDETICRAAAGLQSKVVKNWRLSPGEGIAGWVSNNGESVIISDTRKDRRHFKGVGDKMKVELRSILSVPIRTKEDVIGALQVVDKRIKRFGPSHKSLLEALAATSSTAILNAQLYEQSNREIRERINAEKNLKVRERELKKKTVALKETNIALNVLLKNRGKDQHSTEEKIMTNLKDLVFPYLDKLESSPLNERQKTYLEIAKSNIATIISPFIRSVPHRFYDFTPAELQVADLVKKGRTTREIAEIINSSAKTVEAHRNRLRKKLGLTNQKTKLKDYLTSLP